MTGSHLMNPGLSSEISINRRGHMGGYGSTRWNGYQRHANDREAVKIALAAMREQLRTPLESTHELEALHPNGRLICSGTLTLTRVEQREGRLVRELRFDAHQRGYRWVDVIRLVLVDSRIGRPAWLACCPTCSRQVRTLFVPHRGRIAELSAPPRCRRCCGLRYASQQVAPEERATMAHRRALRRLRPTIRDLIDGAIPRRPKGMHRRTYRRLRDALLASEQARDEIVLSKIDRLTAWVRPTLGGMRVS